ncbi:Ig-like domain-containing protein [Pantoea agglomerans]|uniref:Ig-like domain-containing protein n=1 Tax=Enterobacter agglomerans TaxID=549 RepID=UPI0013C9F243|nr:Ig-like domain-containing protein [Pantoea agglomerans]NEG61863.1 Ig-like domain-containing protein [Pantoea agglomerans]
MAELTQGRVDIISRENGTLISQSVSGSSQSINLTEPSVVRISGTRDMVTQYERQGNDLVLHMRDGKTVRYQKFFLDDADGQHSELVFDDGVNPPEHALFPQTAEGAELASTSVTPTYESLDSVEPLLLADNGNTSMGVITAGGLGVLGLAGLAVGVGGGGGGGGNGGGNDGGTDPGTPVTPGTPAITLNAFAGDDVLDNAEKSSDQVLSGTTSNVEAGQIVTVTLGGQTYNAAVGADGSWSVTIPAAGLAGLAAGTTTIDVSVTNAAGTTTTGSLPITVAAADPGTPAAPSISLNPFAGDNLLDNSEKTTPQTLSGSTSNVEAGQQVSVTLGGQSYNATVGTDGSWSVSIPAAALSALTAGSSTISVSVTSAAGTAAAASLGIQVQAPDTTPGVPALTIAPFTGDDVLSNAEKTSNQILSGSTTNVEAGQIVTVTLGGQSYSGSVADDGSWSITVPADALTALASGTTTVTATVANQAGTAASGSLTVNVEPPLTQPGTPVITIDQFAGDDILSNAEKSSDQVLSGTTTNVEAGQLVTITLGDQTYSAVVDAQGNWSVTLSPAALNALAAGSVAISAVVTSQAGIEVSENRAISIDTPVVPGPPSVTLGDFAGDNVLSNVEKATDQTLTGSTSNVEPGQLVTVTLGGQTYSGSVDPQGNWSITLPSAALSALAAGETTLTVSVSNVAGDTVTGTLPITVEAPVTLPGEPTVTIGQFAGDDILSNDEKGTAQTLSGSTTNIEAGQTVTVTFGGQTYLGTVDGSGNWSVSVPAAALGNLPAGANAISVTVSNADGVSTTEIRDIAVETPVTEPGVPALTLNDFAGDNLLSNDEKAVDQLVSGSTSNIETGQIVTVTLGGQTYSASVQGDGSWSVAVPSAALNALAAGITTLTVSVSNAVGDTVTSTQPVTVEAPVTQPGEATVTIDAFAGDDILSNSEKASDQLLSGTTTNIGEGQQVTVTLNGETFTATVGADGSWSVTIPASSLAALTAGSAALNVTVTDQSGTQITETRDFLVESAGTSPNAPTLTLNAFADDNILSNDEKLEAQAVSGSTTNVEAGQIVTVTLGGQSYSGTVGADGSWNIAIPADALGALAAGSASLVVTVSNAAGTTLSDTLPITVEPPVTEPGQPTITLDQFAVDDVLSNDEKTSDQLLSGSSTNVEAGQVVTVTLGDQTYSATVGADGSWSLSVPASALAALTAGNATIAATVTSQAGVTVSEDRVIAVEAPAEPGTPTVTIALFAGDDLLDNSEKALDQTLSGSTSNVEAGQTVTITLGGQSYNALVNADGNWSTQIPSAALSALAAGSSTIAVSVTTAAGASATDTRDINVAPAAGEPGVVSISEPVSLDGFLNQQELSSDLIISGSAVGVNPGQAVQVNFNGTNYSAVVNSNGFWSVTVPAGDLTTITDGVKLISVTTTDATGALLTDSAQLNVVAATLPQITLEESAITDGLLNRVEAGSDLLIGGSTGKAVPGQQVELELNGKTYSTTVNADGSWSLALPAADLALLPQGANSLIITAIDEAGNRVDETLNFSVDTLPPNLIVAEVAGGDGILNSSEVAAGLPVSGSGALPGEVVSVSLNNESYSATVDGQGNWTVDLPPAALQALSDGSSYTLVVTLTDASGNTTTQTQPLAVSTQPPVATVTAPGGDGVLTNNELTAPLLISGTGTPGDSVTVELNGKSYTAIVDENSNWSASVPVADLGTLTSQTYPVTVTVTDPAGNISTQNTELRVATAVPALTLNDLSDDGVINVSDAQQPLIVSGTGDEGDIIRVTLNNVAYSAVVAQGGSWSVTVPASDLANVPNGTQPVSVVATDADGNTTPASSSLIFATKPPLLEVSTPGSDGYINIAEHTQDLTLDGRGGAQGDTVAVSFNGETYTATVDTDGAWSVTVPAAIISQLGDAIYPVDVVLSDAYGNSSTVPASVTVLAATSPALTINPVTGDNQVDSAEQLTDILVTGNVTGVPAGQPVLLTINGQSYDGVVQANGSWSVSLPAGSLGGAGDKTFTVAITDVAGNPALPAEGQFSVVTSPVPSLSIAPISDDNALNALEAQSDLILSGGSANLPANSPISVTLVTGGTVYSTTTDETGAWTLTVPAADLATLPQGTTTVTVSSGDVQNSLPLLVATTPLADPQINTPFTDGILNTDEASAAQTLTGTVLPGQDVSVTLGGTSYPATVDANGEWSVTIPADRLQALAQGSNPITVTVSDEAGNSTSISEPLTVDTGIPALTVNPIATDGVINAAETATDLTLSGTVTPGSSVSLALNGQTYDAVVAADGSWTATVPAANLQQLPDDRYDLNVTVTTVSGNVATTPVSVTVDTTAPDFSIAAPAGDGVLNIAEQAAGFSFSGAGSEGDRVSVTLNGVTYTGTVDGAGNWALAVPPAALAGLTNGSSYPVVVTVTDAAGNSSSQNSALTVATTPPPLVVAPVSGDNALNVGEVAEPLVVSGSGQNGDVVTVQLNDQLYSTTVGVNGQWTLQIAPEALAALPPGSNLVTVTETSVNGNQSSQVVDLNVATAPDVQPVLTIDSSTFAGDGIVTAAEQLQPITVRGSSTNVEPGQQVIISLNGNEYSGVVEASGNWSIILPAGALAELGEGTQTLNVSVINAVGNTASSTLDFSVDNTLPSIALAPVSDDNYLNAQELGGAVVVSGSTSGLPDGSIVTVLANGTTVSTTVTADGSWSLTLPAGTFTGTADGPQTITATASDANGQPLATSDATLTVIASALPVATPGVAFDDGILNGEEAAAGGTITGNTGVTGDGQTVVVTLGGNNYSGTVDAAGNWQVAVPTDVLSALPQGNSGYTVVVSDVAGNSSQADGNLVVDTLPPVLNFITPSDGIINAAESQQPLTLTGSSEANALIVASFNGTTLSTTADVNGVWSLELPATVYTGLGNGSYPLTVTASDAAGNATTTSRDLALKVEPGTLPTLTLDTFAGNNVVDGAERLTDQRLSGTTTNVEAGQLVTVTVDGTVYSAAVQASGAWSLIVPAGALAAINDGSASFTVAVSDVAGNTSTSNLTFDVNSNASGLAMDAISEDNYLNAQELGQALVVTGTSVNVTEGSTVTLLFNNISYTAQVSASGRWTVIVPAEALTALADGPYTLTVTATDSGGATLSSEAALSVVATLPAPQIVSAFGDGLLNSSEIATAQTLSGTTGITGDGQTVSVLLNGATYNGTVDGNGNWQISVPASALAGLPEDLLNYTVTVQDAAGNTGSSQGSVTVDLTPPTLTLNTVAGDNSVNIAESTAPIVLSGNSNAEAGQQITITLNNQTWTTTVDQNGEWNLTLPAGSLAGIPAGAYILTVTVSDAAGNPVTETREITVATASLAVSIDTPFGDGYLNLAEQGVGQTLTGSTGVAGNGQTVSVTLGGNDYSATVDAQGNWTLTLTADQVQSLGEGVTTLVVNASDAAGNSGSLTSAVTVDLTPPVLTVNAIGGDNIINSEEVLEAVAISGSASIADAGQTVTVSFQNVDYTTQVLSDGTWEVTLPASVVQGLADGSYTVAVSMTDAAGNPATATQEVSFITTPPALTNITVDAGDTLNLAESLQDLTISGNTTGALPVTVTLNNVSYTSTADADGNWSLTIPTADLQQLADGPNAITVSVTDAAGNITTDSTTSLDVAFNTLPALTLNTPFGDALISAADAEGALTLSGGSTNLPEGSVVNISVGGQNFSTTTDASGNWTLNLAPGALTGLADGLTQVVVSAADGAGNPAQVTAGVEILQSDPVSAAFDTTLFGDNIINISEAGSVQLVTGTSTVVPGQTLSVTVGNDNIPLSVTVDANGNWTASLPPEFIASLGTGEHTLTLITTDRAGNSIETTKTFVAAITPIANPTLDTPFIDGRINAEEAAAGGTLTGAVNINNAASVTVTVNGTLYSATLTEGGSRWSLDLPVDVLQSLPDGNLPVSVTVTDANGNIGSTSGTILVAVNALPDVTLNLPFGDGALNAAEAAGEQILSGTTGITGAGQTVTVLISGFNNGQPLAATVQTDGSWSLALSPAQLATFTSGTHTITVTATDIAGNSDATAQNVVTEVALPVPTFNPGAFGGDNLLNISEAAAGVTLTGTTGSVGANQAVSITVDVNGSLYSGTVASNGNWTVNIPASALSSLGDGAQSLTVNVVDAAGNSASAQLPFTSDLSAPQPAVNPEFLGSYVNGGDVAAGVTLSGTTGEAGANQTVQLTLGGTTYSATVDANGNWTVPLTTEELSQLPDDTYPVTVTATDAAGNSTTINSSLVLDTTPPVLNVVAFTGDNALNYAESIQPQSLSGTATGAETGDVVTVSLNNTTLGTAVVDGNGNWSVTLTPEQMATFTPSTTLTLAVTDLAGNTATVPVALTVDLTPPPGPLVTLGTVSGDNIISTQDVAGGVVVSGTSANLGAGGVVTVSIGGQEYATTLDGAGNWSTAALPVSAFGSADGSVAITVNATDGTDSVTTSGNVLIDLTPPALTLNPFTGDNQVNGNESATSQAISGTADLSEVGRTVVVTFNNQTYNAVVQSNGTWSTTVPASAMQALPDGSSPVITAQLADVAGNVTTTTQTVTVDTAAPLVQVDAFLGDNVINAADLVLSQVLTGSAQGAEGQTIGLYLGDAAPIATATVGADGRWSIDLAPDVLASLTEGALVFGVRVNDVAGNQTDATLTVNKVVNSALTLVVDSVFGDGTLSALDTTVAQTISGVATSAGVGATVSVVLGGTTLSASVGQDGKWAIVVPPSVLGLLSDGNLALDVTLTDAAGNTRTVGETVTAIVDAVPVVGALTGLFGGDNLLNIAEAAAGQLVSGVIENAAVGSQVTVTFGSKSYSTTVQAGGVWSVSLPGSDLTSLLDGNLTLGVSVRDVAGNVASSSASIGIFTQTPSISLTSLFGDGVLNLADIATGQVISGVVNNVAQGSVVTLSVGNSQVTATVGAGGAFSATVTPDILGTLAQGNLTVGASVTDAAGNTASTSAGIRVDTLLPTITVNPLFGDGLLNVADSLVTQVIGGVIGGAEAGSRVVVSVGSQQLVTATDANGNFNVSLTPALLQGIADGNLTVGISVTDSAGNTNSTTAGALVGIHNLPKVTLNPLFGDGVLNLAESLVTQTISGTVSGLAAGSSVRLTIGNTIVDAQVNADGSFSTAVSPAILSTLLNGNFTVSAAVTDPVGNVSSTSAGVSLGLFQPTLSVNTVFGDGVLSAADLASNQTLSGTSSLSAGSTVSATLNGLTYTTKVVSGGNWSITVPKADLVAITDGSKTVTVTGTDAYGNVANSSGTLSVISQSTPVVAITSLFGDSALSAADVKTAQTISGTASNAEGSVVRVTLGGQTYSTTVSSNGNWSLSVPAANLAAITDGLQTVTASVTNGAGSIGNTSASLGVVSHTTPTVSVNSFFGGDGYLNIAEANSAETIRGTSTNAAGGTVTVNVAGNILTTTIGANGAWSISVPSATLKGIADGSHPLTVTVADIGGNTATSTSSFTALSHNQPLVGVDPVLSIVGSLLAGLVVQGGSLNAAQGSKVSVTLLLSNGNNGPTLNTTTDALGRYAVNFSPSLLSVGGLLLSLGTLAKVTITDAAGNSYSTTNTLLLGALLPVSLAANESVALFSVADDSATVASAETQHNSSTSSDESSAHVAVASTLITEADTVTPVGSSENAAANDAAIAAAPAEEAGYTIGGVVITLADGSTIEGATVTGSSGADLVTVSDLNFTHIDGGAGTDTLVLNGEHLSLDLTALGLKVEHIEVLDLGKTGTNSVKLDLNEALNITDKQSDDLLIKGADGSQVTLANSNGGIWEVTAERTVEGRVFEIYHNSALTSDNTLGDVLVQQNLQVHVV